MKTPFTAEQLDWLNCRLPEYNARVDKTLPGISETGKMYAVTQATLFLKKWGQLMNATTYSEGKIKETIIKWFQNTRISRRGSHTAGSTVALLPMTERRGKNTMQLYVDSLEDFSADVQARHAVCPTQSYLAVYNTLQKAKWDELSPEQKEQWGANAKALWSAPPDTDTVHAKRAQLYDSLSTILESYSTQTSYSFCLLATGPDPNEPDGPGVTFELHAVADEDSPTFADHYVDYNDHIWIPWKAYASLVEGNCQVAQTLAFINADEEGRPFLPAYNAEWPLSQVVKVLDSYFGQLWYLSRARNPKERSVPWAVIEERPTVFYDPAVLPPGVPTLSSPSKLQDWQAHCLYQHFTALQCSEPPFSPFSFIPPKEEVVPGPPSPKTLAAWKRKQLEVLLREDVSEDLSREGDSATEARDAPTDLPSSPCDHIPSHADHRPASVHTPGCVPSPAVHAPLPLPVPISGPPALPMPSAAIAAPPLIMVPVAEPPPKPNPEPTAADGPRRTTRSAKPKKPFEEPIQPQRGPKRKGVDLDTPGPEDVSPLPSKKGRRPKGKQATASAPILDPRAKRGPGRPRKN